MDELFIVCIRTEMTSYTERRKAFEVEISKKGLSLRRGGYERLKWDSGYIAEQYKLCLTKTCKEPATVRNLICALGDAAVLRMKAILADYEKNQEKVEQKED